MKVRVELTDWQPARWPGAVTLDGNWVRLEPLDAARHGASLWRAVSGRDEVWEWLFDGPYASEELFLGAVAAKAASEVARFYAIVPHGDAPSEALGYASLMRIEPEHGVIEVGNVLFSPALQRTRAATEAIYLLASYVFEELGYRRFEWKCNALNLPSRRAAERFGFQFEGIFRRHMVVKGKSRDTAWFAMVDEDWPRLRDAFEGWLAAENFSAAGEQLRGLASFR